MHAIQFLSFSFCLSNSSHHKSFSDLIKVNILGWKKIEEKYLSLRFSRNLCNDFLRAIGKSVKKIQIKILEKPCEYTENSKTRQAEFEHKKNCLWEKSSQ